jgi:hypothetical protein
LLEIGPATSLCRGARLVSIATSSTWSLETVGPLTARNAAVRAGDTGVLIDQHAGAFRQLDEIATAGLPDDLRVTKQGRATRWR